MSNEKILAPAEEVDLLVKNAAKALAEFASFDQDRIDYIVAKCSVAGLDHHGVLAKAAVDETKRGVFEDKATKNLFACEYVVNNMRHLKTCGVIREDPVTGITEIAEPVGVICGITPVTNPTSTVIFKCLICLKTRNPIIFSFHPNAQESSKAAAIVMREAAEAAGAPKNCIQWIEHPSMDATNALMNHPGVATILATGGNAMVKAAYSSGNPAIGVGAGNGPAYIEKSADVKTAVRHIIESKTFDNGTICASEQSIVTEAVLESEVTGELTAQGGYMLPDADIEKLGKFILRANGTMNPVIVGKSAEKIAELAGIQVPRGTKVLVARQTEVSHKNGYSREKLCPILAFYVERNWEACCERCIELLRNEGSGHTMTIHSKDEKIIREFALKKPVSRLLVNTTGSLGGTGATTGLAPALTLGCGSVGKSSTSDNITPLNLINIRRVAYGTKELSDLRGGAPAPGAANVSVGGVNVTQDQVEAIVRSVLSRLR